MYIGTYTHSIPAGTSGRDDSIFIYDLDLETGQMDQSGVVRGIVNPSFLALSRDRKYLYCTNECLEYRGHFGGGISAFSIDPTSGNLEFINEQFTEGELPCYISLDENNKFAWVANYGSGSLGVFPIDPEGGVAAARRLIVHQGSSIVKDRQESAHAHSAVLDPQGRFILTADLGMDQIQVYELDGVYSGVDTKARNQIDFPAGSGPRHIVFHPNGRWVYVSNELNSTVSFSEYHPEDGRLSARQHSSTLPKGVSGENYPAEIQLHPNNQFLYIANRGHDSIACFQVDPHSGMITAKGHSDTLGRWPRHFAIDPSGRILIAANQESGTVYTFWIQPETGELTPTGYRISIPSPVYIRVYDPENP
jgi:6-phosphogluconolactonase